LRTWGTPWELDESTLGIKTKNSPPPSSPPPPKNSKETKKKKKKKKKPAETSSPWLDKFSIFKTISHHFQPVLISPIINLGVLLTRNSSTTQNHELNICGPYCDTMVIVHIRKGVGTRVLKYHLLKNIFWKFQGFFFQFCDVTHWQSSTRGIGQI